jgi:F-type H+-transporting ATPase subunit delta
VIAGVWPQARAARRQAQELAAHRDRQRPPGALPEIAAQFQALVNAQLGRRPMPWSTAPSRSTRGAGRRGGHAREALRPQAQRPVESTPELIGGIRVVVGDEVLDTSVKARLEQMKVALTA